MKRVCSCCQGTGLADAETDPVAELEAICRERGYWLSPFAEVRTEAAAELLGVTAQSLRTMHCYYGGIESRRAGRHRLYSLEAIADAIARRA